jgi:hypothetical protein
MKLKMPLLIGIVLAIVLVSGCVTRTPIATGKFVEPNDYMCKNDCWNWCKLCEKTPPNDVCGKDYVIQYDSTTLDCICQCFSTK